MLKRNWHYILLIIIAYYLTCLLFKTGGMASPWLPVALGFTPFTYYTFWIHNLPHSRKKNWYLGAGYVLLHLILIGLLIWYNHITFSIKYGSLYVEMGEGYLRQCSISPPWLIAMEVVIFSGVIAFYHWFLYGLLLPDERNKPQCHYPSSSKEEESFHYDTRHHSFLPKPYDPERWMGPHKKYDPYDSHIYDNADCDHDGDGYRDGSVGDSGLWDA